MCASEFSWSTSQCMVSRNPSSRARENTSLNFTGGLPFSSESRPTPTIRSRCGSDCSSASIADSALRSRRKHMISCARRPSVASASCRARWKPSITASNGTPRLVCACGSKKTSA